MEIDQLKQKLPLPDLMERMGYGEHAVAACCSPLRDDRNPSWGIFQRDGIWLWKDHGTGQAGDEITFIQEALNLSKGAAIKHYRRMCGIETVEATIDMTDPPIDWQAAVAAFTPQAATHLQKWRDYSPTFVQWLKDNRLVGIINSRLAFPIQHDPTTPLNGKTSGAHLLNKNRDGWSVLGGKTMPLLIGENTSNAFVFESQWDAFAWMDRIEWYKEMLAVSCVVVTRGASNGRLIHGLLPSTARIYLVPQNDPLDQKGESPATKWVTTIAKLHPRCLIVATPPEYKDLNEWTVGGATKHDLTAAGDEAEIYIDPDAPILPNAFPWPALLTFKPSEDKDSILGNRWLCRGSSCVWVGGSGLGKSVLSLQAAMHWAAGQPFFGIKPKIPLTSLIIEAENDFGDVAETVQGVQTGLLSAHPTLDFDQVTERVKIARLVNVTGYDFIVQVKELIADHQPDQLWIDPLLCYLGGDINSQEEVGTFVNHLGELALSTGTIIHLIHHTGKPKTAKDTKGMTSADLSYAGIGSSILTNWARAIMVLQTVRGEEGIFQLTAAKRGKRANLQHPKHEFPATSIFLQHSPEGLCWIASDYEPEEGSTGRKKTDIPFARIKSIIEGGFRTKNKTATMLAEEFNVDPKTASRRIDNLIKNGSVGTNQEGDLIWRC